MHYGRLLYRLIRDVVIAYPALVPVYVLKADIGNVFYLIGMQPMEAPTMGLVSPLDVSGEDMVAIPFTLPMGCKNSMPIFCAAKDTVVDLVNASLRCNQPSHKHKLEELTEVVVLTDSLHL